MASEIGWVGLGVVPQVDGSFYKQLGRDVDPGLAKVGKDSGGRFGRLLGKAAAVTAVGALGVGIAAFKLGKDAVGLAANFEQSVGAVDAVFDKSSKRIHKWADDAAMDVGLSANEFNELGTLIGSQLKNGGTAMEELAPKTRELITQGADMASMFGGTTKEAVEALSSALKGERDPIERYGVSLNQAKIDAEAAELGFKKVDGALSNQATQAATLSLIMEQTADAHGNFARESDTLAGKQQRLGARFEDVKTKLGTALLPIVTEATEYLLNKGVPAFEKFSDWFASDGIDGIQDFTKYAKNEVVPVLKDVAGFLADSAKFGGDVLQALNKLPNPAKYAALAALVTGGVALKVRGGKGGALGTAGQALGLAKPVPVFVTNQGFGTGTGTGAGGKGGKVGKLLPVVGKGGSIVAVAAVASGAATWGIHGLGEKFAPDQTARGNFGTPQGGPGTVLASDEEGKILNLWGDTGKKSGEFFGRAFHDKIADAVHEIQWGLLPDALRTDIALNGVPESKRAVRELVAQYDATPAEKRTLFSLAGFDQTLDRIKRVNAELDWAARPREARLKITKSYADAGYQTYGGLQEGMSNDSSMRRSQRRGLGGV